MDIGNSGGTAEARSTGRLPAGTPAAVIASLIGSCATAARLRAASNHSMLSAQRAAADAAREEAVAATERLGRTWVTQEALLARWRTRHGGRGAAPGRDGYQPALGPENTGEL